ncbi:phage tail protein I [Shewanella surugensis]|uniref:Phage tail protein I n=1 Tax=Shewanella surugensis TaxID=212020 RepID=A0ABT0L8Y3_9GAMM|nr:phage tail protein I [Shewanella surugensis]MCL1124163.1 phage tail protein I [Shewanella surugensis]
MTNSLLPSNASQLERDVEAVISPPLSFPTRHIRSSRDCAEHLLPYLAWESAVDDWDSNWSVERKRKVIQDSSYIHKKRGTKSAIERVASAINGQVKVIEWFEDEERLAPGHFEVSYLSTVEPIDISELVKLVPAFNAAKNLRSTLDNIVVTSQVKNLSKYICFSRQRIDIKLGPWGA